MEFLRQLLESFNKLDFHSIGDGYIFGFNDYTYTIHFDKESGKGEESNFPVTLTLLVFVQKENNPSEDMEIPDLPVTVMAELQTHIEDNSFDYNYGSISSVHREDPYRKCYLNISSEFKIAETPESKKAIQMLNAAGLLNNLNAALSKVLKDHKEVGKIEASLVNGMCDDVDSHEAKRRSDY